MKKKLLLTLMLFVMLFWVAACGGGKESAPATEEPAAEASAQEEQPQEEQAQEEPTAEPTEAPAEESSGGGERVKVRWFVGLGAGTDEGAIPPQEEFVKRFNESQDKIELVLEIVDNDAAYDALATQIAAGNAPCIVGPVGIRGRDTFKGAWLDLQPLIEKYNYDMSDFDPAIGEVL